MPALFQGCTISRCLFAPGLTVQGYLCPLPQALFVSGACGCKKKGGGVGRCEEVVHHEDGAPGEARRGTTFCAIYPPDKRWDRTAAAFKSFPPAVARKIAPSGRKRFGSARSEASQPTRKSALAGCLHRSAARPHHRGEPIRSEDNSIRP